MTLAESGLRLREWVTEPSKPISPVSYIVATTTLTPVICTQISLLMSSLTAVNSDKILVLIANLSSLMVKVFISYRLALPNLLPKWVVEGSIMEDLQYPIGQRPVTAKADTLLVL